MKYRILIVKSAEKEINKTKGRKFDRISRKILSLETNPRPHGVKKLTNREEYRIRAGDYRILYRINDSYKKVTIIAFGHRKEVYK